MAFITTYRFRCTVSVIIVLLSDPYSVSFTIQYIFFFRSVLKKIACSSGFCPFADCRKCPMTCHTTYKPQPFSERLLLFFFGHLSTVTMNYKSTRHAFCVNHLITFSRYTTEYDQKISKKDARLMYNISESAYCHVERKQTTQR